MTTVEGADADGEDNVERLVIIQENEVFDGHMTDAHPCGGDLVARGDFGLGDGSWRPVDGQDVAGDETVGHGPCYRARPAANLKHAGVWLQGQGVHDRGEQGRQAGGHGPQAIGTDGDRCGFGARVSRLSGALEDRRPNVPL